MRILIEKLKTFTKPLSKGLCCFVGIDEKDNEIVHTLEPVIINSQFIYRCSSKFDVHTVNHLFKSDDKLGALILVSGDLTCIYQANPGGFECKEKIIGNLVKRQKKGGQSSVRFSRLAEESRHHYVTRIVESINKHCISAKITYIFGSQEIKEQIMERKTSLVKLNTLAKWYTWTTGQPSEFINANRKEILSLLSKSQNDDDTKVQNILTLVSKNPDWLVFGEDIKASQCEYVVMLADLKKDDTESENVIYVEKNSQYYGAFKAYQRIGKKYYLDENQWNLDEGDHQDDNGCVSL